jgi:two-component system LytT family sensor kinase
MNLTRFYIWAVMAPLIFIIISRFPVEFRPLRLSALLFHIPVLFLCSGVHQLIFMAAGWYFDPSFSRRFSSITEFYRTAFLAGLYLNILIASLIFITAHAFLYYQHYRAGQIQQSLLKEQLAKAQFQALKMQLHPHFLFNALHSISALVLEDPPKANSMIARLGDFLRFTLEHSTEQVIVLQQEIEFLRCYLEIEQVRFDDRLTITFEIDQSSLSAQVPQLILQPLVENAIRHAIAPRDAAGHISLKARRVDGRLRLEVKDNGPGIGEGGRESSKRGVGLKNVRARLEQLYGTEYSFEMVNAPTGGLSVVLEMPFQSDINNFTNAG